MSPATTVHDTIASGIELELSNGGSIVSMSDTNATRLLKAIAEFKKSIYTSDAAIDFMGLPCVVLEEGSKVSQNKNDKVEVDLRVDVDGVHTRVSYTVFKHNLSKRWMLRAIANPTTLSRGTNAFPVVVEGQHPDACATILRMFQLPFEFLFSLLKFKPAGDLRKSIKSGNIGVSNCQWAFYLPSKNRSVDISIIRHLYMRLAITKGVFLSEFLGLHPEVRADMSDYSVSMRRSISRGGDRFDKKKRTYVFSVSFYDKLAQLENKGADRYLTKEQRAFLEKVIRVDITFHKPQLESMIREAKSFIKKLDKAGIEHPPCRNFVDSTEVTAYTVARAMSILTWVLDGDRLTKGRFSSYLIESILCGELKLDALLNRSPSTDKLTKREKDFLEFWNTFSFEDSEHSLASSYAKSTGISMTVSNETARNLRNYGYPIDVPSMFVEQLDALDSVYGLTEDELVILNTSTNPNETHRLVQLGKKRVRRHRDSMRLSLDQAVAITDVKYIAMME